MALSAECRVYESHSLRTRKTREPFPINEHDLTMYIRYRGRNSTFCNHLSNLEQHPLHGGAWLKRMRRSSEVQEELKKFLKAWDIPRRQYPSLLRPSNRTLSDTYDYFATLPPSVQRKISGKSTTPTTNEKVAVAAVSSVKPVKNSPNRYDKSVQHYDDLIKGKMRQMDAPTYSRPGKVVYHTFKEEDMDICDKPIDLGNVRGMTMYHKSYGMDAIKPPPPPPQTTTHNEVYPENSEKETYVLIETLDPARQADNYLLNDTTETTPISEAQEGKYNRKELDEDQFTDEDQFVDVEEEMGPTIYTHVDPFEEQDEHDVQELDIGNLEPIEKNIISTTVVSKQIRRNEMEEEEKEEEEYDEDMKLYKNSLNEKKINEEALGLLGYGLKDADLHVLSHVAIEKSFR